MKYKLINRLTEEEHICDKVTGDGFDYYVGAMPNKFYEGWYELDGKLFHTSKTMLQTGCKSLIATNNPSVDVPQVVDEVDSFVDEIYVGQGDYFEAGQRLGRIEGYDKAKETYKFKEEDIEFFIKKTLEVAEKSVIWSSEYYKHILKELLQLWKDQQPIKVYYEN